MSDVYFAITMLIVLGLVVALWAAAWRFKPTRRFWGLLAAGWSFGLGGNIAWGIAFPPGADLPSFSWLDLFYTVALCVGGDGLGVVCKAKDFPYLVGLCRFDRACGSGGVSCHPANFLGVACFALGLACRAEHVSPAGCTDTYSGNLGLVRLARESMEARPCLVDRRFVCL